MARLNTNYQPPEWMINPQTGRLWENDQQIARAYNQFHRETKDSRKLVSYTGRSGLLEQPQIEWALDQVIQDHSINMLFGESETFKTFFAIDWAWTLNSKTKEDWNGFRRFRRYKPMFVFTEGRGGLQQRMLAWEQHNKEKTLEDTGIEWVFDQVDMMQYEIRDRYGRLIDKTEDAHLPDHAKLMNLYRERGCDMLILDTLSATMRGDTNDNAAAQRYMDSLLEFTEFGPVLVTHHTQKGDAKTYRGASSFKNSSDVMLVSVRSGNDRATLSHYKFKDGAKATIGTFGKRIHSLEDGRTSITLQPETVGELTPEQRGLLELLSSVGPVTAPDLAQARDGNKKSRAAVQRMLTRIAEHPLGPVEYDPQTGLWQALMDEVEELT